MQETPRLLGAIEAGGTKLICAVGTSGAPPLAEARLPTTSPEATLGAALDFFRQAASAHGPLAGLGIASFGPLSLDPAAPDHGCITRTPKPGWSGTDLVAPFRSALGCPVALDTDVNAAAMAEGRWGAGQGCSVLAYVTVGTGIGGGLLMHGRPVHGLMHPEIGHLRPRRHPHDLGFAGICPFHGDCAEGLASGPAIIARSGRSLDALPPDHPAWSIVADVLGQLCADLVLMVSPQRIVLGGGVMQQAALFPLIRRQAAHWLAGYVAPLDAPSAFDALIVPAALGQTAGLAGGFLLAEAAANG